MSYVTQSSIATAVALALYGSTVLAAPQAGGEVATLETVMVTAQRRSENLQDVPVSVTAVGGEKLDVLGSGGDDIRFLSGRMPSLLIESSFGRAFPRFYIRGLGNTEFDLNASQPVSLVYDDVVQENPILKGFPVFDVDQVEMYRGPQGTLFGRNTPAGVIKVSSVRPSREAGGYFQAGFGEDYSMNAEGAIGGPVGENWAVRFSGMYQRREGWIDNTFTGASDSLEGFDELAARAQFLYQPNDDFSALLNVHTRSLDGTARVFRANIFQPGTNHLVSGFRPDQVSLDGRNEQDLDSTGASVRLQWDTGRVTLHSVTGYETVSMYSRGDIDGGFGAVFLPPGLSGPGVIAFPAESADGLPDHSQFTQEFRWESNEWGAFDWQAGVFYFDEGISIDSFSYNTLGGGVRDGYAVQHADNRSWAIFGSMDYDVSDAFNVRAGIRYTDDEKKFSAERTLSSLSGFGAPNQLGPISVATSDQDFSWDLSGTWKLSDDTNVFARVAKGYRAPSIQGRLLFSFFDGVSVADAETVLSLEAGIKTEIMGGRGRISLTAYSFDMDDQQLTAVGGAGNTTQLLNADKTKGMGIELDAEAFLTDSLFATLGVSYNDTEIDDASLAVVPCGGGCTVLDPPGTVPGTVSIHGNRLPQSPELIANFTARWGMPMGSGEFFVFTDWAYRSDISFMLYESAEFRGKALLEGGLRIGYNFANDSQVAIYGRNITDEIVAVGGIDFNNLTGFINEPRRWGVEFSTRF